MEIKQIPIHKIMLDKLNPRGPATTGEAEALKYIIDTYSKETQNLARHISENGLNPSDLPILLADTDSGNYIVLEGNRRFTAIKLLVDPSLVPPDHIKLKKTLQKLSTNYTKNTLIRCVIFETREEAKKWIALKHTGEQSGLGVKSWTALQQARFDASNYPKSMLLIDYMFSERLFNTTVLNSIDKLPISTLERLLNDPYINKKLHTVFGKAKLKSSLGQNEFRKHCNKIFDDLINKYIKVDDVKNKAQRRIYIDSFNISDVPLDGANLIPIAHTVTTPNIQTENIDAQVSLLTPKSDEHTDGETNTVVQFTPSPGDFNTTSPKIPTNTNIYYNTKNRKTLISRNFKLITDSPKINNLFQELKKLDVYSFNNTVSISLRVFLELSVDLYIQKNNVKLSKNDKQNLISKIRVVLKDLEDKEVISHQQNTQMFISMSTPTNLNSTTNLNNYVHSFIQASGMDLIVLWDNIQPFIEALYSL